MTLNLLSRAEEVATVVSDWPGVEAAVLAGSLAAGTEDQRSDIDLYIYKSAFPDLEIRLSLAKALGSAWEIGNTFWETEDLIVMKDGVKVELVWRDLSFPRSELERTLVRHEAWVGYSTCVWHNVLYSEILSDHGGEYT